MFRTFVSLTLVQAFVVAALLVSGAQATSIPITVLNNSFEDAGSTPGALSLTISDWTDMTNGTHYSQNATCADGYCRLLLATPSAPSTAVSPNAQIEQVLSTNFAASTKYSLTVAIGGNIQNPATDSDGGAYDIALYAGTTQLVAASGTNYVGSGPTMSYKDLTITYDPSAPGAPTGTVGDALQIQLKGKDNYSGQFWTVYDNVRLTSEAVPEPRHTVLLATGLIGLLCYAWRKRK